MAEPKTRPTDASVEDFLSTIEPAERQRDGFKLLALFEKATGEKAVMWGPAIVGFGQYQSRSGDWPLSAFSPRKQTLTLYVMDGSEQHQELFERLGKHTASKSCLYIKRLSDVDEGVLAGLIERAFAYARQTYT